MSNGSRRLSRGDRRRNEKLAQLRAVITRETAVLAFDLAADKQVCALTDPDSRVLARRTVNAQGLAAAPRSSTGDWPRPPRPGSPRSWSPASRPGTAGGCSTRSPRSSGVQAGLRAAAAGAPGPGGRGLHPQQERRHRRDRSSPGWSPSCAATCPSGPTRRGPGCGTWARAGPGWSPTPARPASRSGPARVRLAGGAGGRRQAAGLGELAGRGDRAAGPGRRHRRAELCSAAGLGPVRRRGPPRAPPPGATRWYSVIVRAVFDAATDPAQAAVGVAGQRAGALERVRFALADLAHARAEIAVVETRMVQVLDTLGLTELVTSIPGVSAVGAAAILAETGDPTRFSCARALVKHAGLCPRDNASGTYAGHDRDQRPRPPRAPAGRLARGVGRVAQQPRARRPPRPPHRPRRQPAHRHPSPHRRRRQPAAPAARRDHHPHRLGPGRRRRLTRTPATARRAAAAA